MQRPLPIRLEPPCTRSRPSRTSSKPVAGLVANHPDIHAEGVAWSEEAWETDSFRRIGRRTRKDGTFVDVELLAVRVSHDTYYILYHDVTELERAPTAADPGRRAARRARPHRRARRFLPRQVAGGLLAGQLRAEKPFERRRITILSADMVGFSESAGQKRCERGDSNSHGLSATGS